MHSQWTDFRSPGDCPTKHHYSDSRASGPRGALCREVGAVAPASGCPCREGARGQHSPGLTVSPALSLSPASLLSAPALFSASVS